MHVANFLRRFFNLLLLKYASSFPSRYGDKAPRSFFARVFGIVWILVGLVIISTFTATITTVLTASSLSNEVKLYGTKVGALANSEEFRLGVKRNADVKGNEFDKL